MEALACHLLPVVWPSLAFLPPTTDTQDISGPWTPWWWVWLSQPRPGLTCWVLPAARWVAGLKQRTSLCLGLALWQSRSQDAELQSRRCEHGLLPAVANELVWPLSYPLSCWDVPLLSMASWEVAWDPGVLHPNQNSLDSAGISPLRRESLCSQRLRRAIILLLTPPQHPSLQAKSPAPSRVLGLIECVRMLELQPPWRRVIIPFEREEAEAQIGEGPLRQPKTMEHNLVNPTPTPSPSLLETQGLAAASPRPACFLLLGSLNGYPVIATPRFQIQLAVSQQPLGQCLGPLGLPCWLKQ